MSSGEKAASGQEARDSAAFREKTLSQDFFSGFQMQPRPSIPSSELEQYTSAFVELYRAQQDLISEALG